MSLFRVVYIDSTLFFLIPACSIIITAFGQILATLSRKYLAHSTGLILCPRRQVNVSPLPGFPISFCKMRSWTERPGVSTARLSPLRKKPLPLSLRGREKPPLFEKSNVLVLYVSNCYHPRQLLTCLKPSAEAQRVLVGLVNSRSPHHIFTGPTLL